MSKDLSLAVLSVLMAGFASSATPSPLLGFTPFPYDATPEAVQRTQALLGGHANLHALHLDDGVPWAELLDERPLPPRILREWADWKRAVPAGRPVYLGLAPLAKDRKSLAPGKGEKDGLGLPWRLRLAGLNDPLVLKAYTAYAKQAVQYFQPAYLNIGIEAGELAARDPGRWPAFEQLFRHVRAELRNDFPQLKVGISFGLQSLRKPEVAARARALVEASDYLCLSFYPHMSAFGERFGDPPLADGELAWREPLAWVRRYTSRPLAMCETGYSTRPAELQSYKLSLPGDTGSQTRYLTDLLATAMADQYLFVVWFLAVDYDPLYERLKGQPGQEQNLLWRNVGLWSSDLLPKPALSVWRRSLPAGLSGGAAKAASANLPDRTGSFAAGPGGQTLVDDAGVVQWRYSYQGSDWMWMVHEPRTPWPAAARRLQLRWKSDRGGPLFLQLEEQGGEAFFLQLEPGTDWADLTLDLARFRLDPAKRRDGLLQPERVVKITWADAAGRSKASGSRTVQIARWQVE